MELTVLESRETTHRTGIVHKVEKQFTSEIHFRMNTCTHKKLFFFHIICVSNVKLRYQRVTISINTYKVDIILNYCNTIKESLMHLTCEKSVFFFKL